MPDYGKGSGVSSEAVSVENSDHIDHIDMVSGLCGSTYAIQDGAKNKIWIRMKLKNSSVKKTIQDGTVT